MKQPHKLEKEKTGNGTNCVVEEESSGFEGNPRLQHANVKWAGVKKWEVEAAE